MNAFDGILEEQNAIGLEIVHEAIKPFREVTENFDSFMIEVYDAIKKYKETKELPDTCLLEKWSSDGITEVRRNSTKENVEPKKIKKEKVVEQSSPPRESRPRRNAFKEASLNINQQSNMTLSTKLRRPTDSVENAKNLRVKQEKLTMCNTAVESDPSKTNEDTIDHDATSQVCVKEEAVEMPAPNRPAPRRKKRKGTDRKIKQEQLDLEQQEHEEKEEKRKMQLVRDSDVIVQDVTVTIVNLDSSDDMDENTIKTHTKSKRSRASSSEDEKRRANEKRVKSTPKEDTDHTLCEDAATPGNNNNATYVAKSAAPNMNATVVIEQAKFVKNLIPQTVNDLMTDDESEEEVVIKPVQKRVGGIPVAKKPIFSPFEQSPVKKKVQAFEKLQEEASALPARITRTKTRAQAKKQQEEEQEAEPSKLDDLHSTTNVKEKAKIFTPMGARFMPKAASTTQKSNRMLSSSTAAIDKSVISAKSASALKASQAEYREREKKRREKEQEALKKREAIIQQQIEEKKREREEKQLKAQQRREALEKEKLKTLEVQRLKDERHKQLVAEQEERKLKQKEEHEKKRQMAKVRALEEKKREEEKWREEQKRTEEMALQLSKRGPEIAQMALKQKERFKVEPPVYMRSPAPRLPTPDCFDSDEEEGRRADGEVKIELPHWAKEVQLKAMLKCAVAAGERLKNTFFSIQAQTPDLQDIFEAIEPKKLKRTSSAVWTKPPRFTMFPLLENHDETEEFDDVFED